MRLRRPALATVERFARVFPVTYAAVDDLLPTLIADIRPHALLMFGLAARTAHLRIETRARNAVTTLWPDADHAPVRRATITADGEARPFGPHTLRLLRAAQSTGTARMTIEGSCRPSIA